MESNFKHIVLKKLPTAIVISTFCGATVMDIAEAHAAPNWRLLGGLACTVAGVLTANPITGAALIGLQGVIITSGAKAQQNGVPVAMASYQLLPGPELDLQSAAGQAFLAMDPAQIVLPADGSPCSAGRCVGALDGFQCGLSGCVLPANVRTFVQKANVAIARRVTVGQDGTVRASLQGLGVALEDAADAYDSLGLNASVASSDVTNFKASCAGGSLPPDEDNMFASAGLSVGQRTSVANYFATVETNFSSPVAVSNLMHQEAAQFMAMGAASTAPVPALPRWSIVGLIGLLLLLGIQLLSRKQTPQALR